MLIHIFVIIPDLSNHKCAFPLEIKIALGCTILLKTHPLLTGNLLILPIFSPLDSVANIHYFKTPQTEIDTHRAPKYSISKKFNLRLFVLTLYIKN